MRRSPVWLPPSQAPRSPLAACHHAPHGSRVFGPSAAAARLEGSKSFMKDLCAKYNIPTGQHAAFTDAAEAKAYITEQVRRACQGPLCTQMALLENRRWPRSVFKQLDFVRCAVVLAHQTAGGCAGRADCSEGQWLGSREGRGGGHHGAGSLRRCGRYAARQGIRRGR